jgi:hypothetical protein
LDYPKFLLIYLLDYLKIMQYDPINKTENKIKVIKKYNLRRWDKQGGEEREKSTNRSYNYGTKLYNENKEMVDSADNIAEKILAEQGKNKYRDHFFPLMIDSMGLKSGVEIGVDKAQFSLSILNKTKITDYYCIDTWQDNFGSNCRPGFFDEDGNKRFLEAQKSLQSFIDNRRATMIRKTSIEAYMGFEDGSLDFCYIDGDHSLLGIIDDLRSWVPKIKIGGICGGHDYKDGPRSGITDFFGKQLDYKIKTAVDDFCARYGYPLKVVGGRILSWYFIKNRNM